MATGMPTHFQAADGDPVAIETHVHLFSDLAKAALAAGWQLAELREQVIDDRWVKSKPSWAPTVECQSALRGYGGVRIDSRELQA